MSMPLSCGDAPAEADVDDGCGIKTCLSEGSLQAPPPASNSLANGKSDLSPCDHLPTMRVLYLFSGASRKCDVRESLIALQLEFGFVLDIKEVDLIRDSSHDVADDSFWRGILTELGSGIFFLLIVTPPCNTHSRARANWKEIPGPRPLRNLHFPHGFPWLEGPRLQAANLANLLIDRTFEAIRVAMDVGTFYLTEFPEDLGVTTSGHLPASLWQLQEQRDIVHESGGTTWAFFQCSFDVDYSKPTRCASDLITAKQEPYQGLAHF